LPYDAAWCPKCKAFREASATVDPEPWLTSEELVKALIKEKEKEEKNANKNLRGK
jgi:hypothetical protein